ncbi:MAG TPA: flavodoxin family protein [Candidatus Hydrogenedentes bacterium]|nr:flavodoxin family protein [Candidatus Hydrogenedentota bacterium]HOV73741.1 flavodoxin family protein [Candidatus Hydrogenedentota bacterium]HPC17078.1 flavodoxin family protein [Candidatus Hydrogenedentota bacterium]HRT20539.1 flavodoxin family protein [Candidatus Hydrogenedentota bacterium]HRT65256.1 flavodoxin family protein [Candidatus Hydrogenedentota bacterium]
MKIVAVLGSPRSNGNSAAIAGRFLETAAKHGAEIRSFILNDLTYRGCQACMACKKTSETCILQDDLSGVLQAVREADVVVLASPVYYGDVTGQMKLFIDRTYCFLTPDFHSNPKRSRLAPGKIAVFVQTQGLADDSIFADVFPRYQAMLAFIGIEEAHLLRGCGLAKRDDVRNRADVLEQAEELAVRLLKQNDR